jgi:hypothetical protein
MNFKLILAIIGMNLLFSSAAPHGKNNKYMKGGKEDVEEVTVYETEYEVLTVAVPASAVIIENETPAIIEGDEIVYLPEEAFDGVEYILEEKLEESKLEALNGEEDDEVNDDGGDEMEIIIEEERVRYEPQEFVTPTPETEDNEPVDDAVYTASAESIQNEEKKIDVEKPADDIGEKETIVMEEEKEEEEEEEGEEEEESTSSATEESTSSSTEEEEDTSGTTDEEETSSSNEEEEDTSGTDKEDTSGTTEEEEEEEELENDDEEENELEVDEEEVNEEEVNEEDVDVEEEEEEDQEGSTDEEEDK